MPMLFPTTAQTPESVLAAIPSDTSPAKPCYMIFFASPTSTGLSWCPDCLRAMQPISDHIPDEQSSLVYVGSRDEWGDKANPFRKAFGIERLPTVVKITDSNHSLTSSVSRIFSE